jgi:hypothetical protein
LTPASTLRHVCRKDHNAIVIEDVGVADATPLAAGDGVGDARMVAEAPGMRDAGGVGVALQATSSAASVRARMVSDMMDTTGYSAEWAARSAIAEMAEFESLSTQPQSCRRACQ